MEPAQPKAGPASQHHDATYAAELADLDRRVAHFLARAEARPDSAASAQAVDHLVERAHLSGDYADFSRAEAVLAAAFAVSPEGAGPHAAAAGLDYTLHRYDAAAKHLARSPNRGLEAAIAFERGEVAQAVPVMETMAESGEPVDLSRLAVARWKTGDLEGAEALLDQAEASYHGRQHRPRAWVHLQRGLIDLDYGRLDEALAHYRDAAAAFEGYWLVDEHIAEVALQKGDLVEAERMYAELVERTGNPEFMDRLAETLEQAGRPDEARAMVRRARSVYDERLAAYPEAAWGHALDHWLAWGDSEEALVMAQKNHANRPNLEATLGLAEAMVHVGRLDEAKGLLAKLRAGPYRSPAIDELEASLTKAENTP